MRDALIKSIGVAKQTLTNDWEQVIKKISAFPHTQRPCVQDYHLSVTINPKH